MAITNDEQIETAGPIQSRTTGGRPADNYLTGDPLYKGSGGDAESQAYYAWTKFKQLFGRNPTQIELDQLTPAYASGDKHVANLAGGNAAVAQYYQNQYNGPEKQYADQQAKYKEAAPQFYDQINKQFQSTVGRDATDDEKEHFGSLLASGQVDQYTIGQFLSQLPDAVRKQDEEFRGGLRNEIKNEDARYFNEQITPGLQSTYARQGRSFDSSGFKNALAGAAQQQNVGRENFLTNLTASQYAGNKANAYSAYLNSVDRQQGQQDYSQGRRDFMNDANMGRIQQFQDYAIQKQAYDNYLGRYGKRSGGASGAAGGAASGAALGTSILPGWGTAIGAVGGGIAGYFAGR